eukprot:GHVU01127023.1.p1 GENE.GHVU01127023.1~~GHVU01127023.1.p1  ORF type:complete len:285 (-),score=57.24 GHVU01127023.1:34-804(-)
MGAGGGAGGNQGGGTSDLQHHHGGGGEFDGREYGGADNSCGGRDQYDRGRDGPSYLSNYHRHNYNHYHYSNIHGRYGRDFDPVEAANVRRQRRKLIAEVVQDICELASPEGGNPPKFSPEVYVRKDSLELHPVYLTAKALWASKSMVENKHLPYVETVVWFLDNSWRLLQAVKTSDRIDVGQKLETVAQLRKLLSNRMRDHDDLPSCLSRIVDVVALAQQSQQSQQSQQQQPGGVLPADAAATTTTTTPGVGGGGV